MSKSESEEMKLLANVGGRGMWVHRASHRKGGTRTASGTRTAAEREGGDG